MAKSSSAGGRRAIPAAVARVLPLGIGAFATPVTTADPKAAAPAGAPDVILVNCSVLTMNARGTVSEAVALKGDTIVDVGTVARLKGLAGPATRIIDLEGKTVVPGFVDPRV